MSSAHQDHAALAYFQTSPVRGQLEPYEPQSRAGWRYLQCTDTPNELKVCRPLVPMARSNCSPGFVAPQDRSNVQPTPPVRGF
jgi:hypothetical protein